MLRVEYRYNHVSVLAVPTVLQLVLLALLQRLDVSRCRLLVVSHLFCDYLTVPIVLLAQLLHLLNRSFCNLLVSLKLLITTTCLLLATVGSLSPLCEEHAPFSHVIHGFVLM